MPTSMPCSITDGEQHDETFREVEIPDGFTLINHIPLTRATTLVSDALAEQAPNADHDYLTELLTQFRKAGSARTMLQRPETLFRFLATFESCLHCAGDDESLQAEYLEQL